MEKKHSEHNSKHSKHSALLAATADTATKVGTLTLLSLLVGHEDLAADLDDIHNRLIVLLEKHCPEICKKAADGTFYTKIREEIKKRDIENLMKEEN